MYNKRNSISLRSVLTGFASMATISSALVSTAQAAARTAAEKYRAEHANKATPRRLRFRNSRKAAQTRAFSASTEDFVCAPERIPLYLHAARRVREGNALVKAAYARQKTVAA